MSSATSRLCYTPRPASSTIQVLFERLHGVSYGQAMQGDIEEVQAGMAAILDELGLDVDVPELRAYTDLLKEQATELEAEMQSLRLHPRYAALIVEGPFGFPMVIDGPREVERLDGVIEQIEAGLQRLSSTEALQEVRGAIREYRDSEERHTRARRRRRQ